MEEQKKQKKHTINGKMVAINPTLSVITLNVHGSSILIKMQELLDWLKINKSPTRNMKKLKRYRQVNSKRMEKICHAKTNDKRAGSAVSSNKIISGKK